MSNFDQKFSGPVTAGLIKERMSSATIRDITPEAFSNFEELHTVLKSRGTMTLEDAVLSAGNLGFIGVHKLRMIGSTIDTEGGDLIIICNELEMSRSQFRSFHDQLADDGVNATSAGGDGGVGTDGRHGGRLRVFVTSELDPSGGKILITLNGQTGGHGGKGADGSIGANGRHGRSYSPGYTGFDCTNCDDGDPGHPGSPGGKAGRGGNGGDGGSAEFWLFDERPLAREMFSFLSQPGTGGGAGRPGKGGPGGNGGSSGRSGNLRCNKLCHQGPPGPHGTDGVGATAGHDGQPGRLLRSTFDIHGLQDVFEEIGFHPGANFLKAESQPLKVTTAARHKMTGY